MDDMKNCNQYFVKDSLRDHAHLGTAKCAVCGEESSISKKALPLEMTVFNKWMKAFMWLHSKKGCNDTKVKAPEWASKEVSVSIAV